MNEHQIVLNLTAVVVLGVGAQWLAWRLRLPSILLLLTFGLLAGPGADALTGQPLLQPDLLLPGLLLPLTSFAVGLILFEGGLTLRLKEMREVGRTLLLLVTVGALVAWLLASGAAYALGLANGQVSLLLGAILVVTGPTVVGPLLRHIRPTGWSATLLKWEGIVIDPIGATLALLVFEAILVGSVGAGLAQGAIGFLVTIVTGCALGALGGALIVFPYRRHWIPDYLEAPVTFMVVIAVFSASNMIQEEAGLLTTTFMGIVVGNALGEAAKPISHFQENLQVLLISALFIVLAARLDASSMAGALTWSALGFLLILVLVVRPASVLISTIGSPLSWRERAFLSWMAPRGIVAAAVASVFALRLAEHQLEGSEALASLTFVVIIGTVALYGLTGAWVARRLGLADSSPQGLMILGANAFTQALAAVLTEKRFQVTLIDTSRRNVTQARLAGLTAVQANVLSPLAWEKLDLGGMGRFLAMTPNDEVNTLAAERFLETFGRANVYQLPPAAQREEVEAHERARGLFAHTANLQSLLARLHAGHQVRVTPLSEAFGFAEWTAQHGPDALPLFLINPKNDLIVLASDGTTAPQAGDLLIGLVPEGPSSVSGRLPKDAPKP